MKILITTDNIGGVWTYSLNLARGPQLAGMDVCLAVIGEQLSLRQKKELEFVTSYFFSCRQEWMENPWDDIDRTGPMLIELAESSGFEIIHLNSYSFGSLPWKVPVVMTAHSCVGTWWEAVKREPLPDKWSEYSRRVRKGVKAADFIVAPSQFMLDSVKRLYGPENMSQVIYNGCDQKQFFCEKKENYVFSMGRLWDEAKNIKLILDAAPEIKYPIYIAGDQAGLAISDIPPNVHFTGHLPANEVAIWLSKAAIYLLPVKYEPFGYTFLEAAFSSCAIITGDIESMHEIWKNTVFYTDPYDSNGLASKINMLMASEYQRKKISGKSLNRAHARYTSDRMTAEYFKLYSDLAGTKVNTILTSEAQ